MQYQALYRRYRPQRFAEIVGQEHVTRTLAREVVEGKIAHAYLFSGPRGTGKTTTARILAKALNCVDRTPEGEPCNRCASCLAITEGTSLDVIELDAASHNKVEDVREIRVNVGTVAAAEGAHRVYILDEAHMLSRAAGNALLKTLEEPPEHVVFVLATTEPYKLLDTIRSRAQRFDFLPVASELVVGHLVDIAGREGFDVDRAGLAAVAEHARGSVRDAMSLLEQVAALGAGTVRTEGVSRALGLAERTAFSALADAIARGDAPAALELVAGLSSRGVDLRRFVADALGFFRGVFLAHYAPNLEEVVDEPPEVLDRWRRTATVLSAPDVLRTLDRLAAALLELRRGREERLVVELTLLQLTRPETAWDPAATAARLDRLEQRVAHLERTATSAGAAATSVERPADGPLPREEAPPTAEAAPPPDLTLEALEAAWPAIVLRIRNVAGPRRHAFLKEAAPAAIEDGAAILAVPGHLHFHLEQLRADDELAVALTAVAADLLGGPVRFVFRAVDGPDLPPEPTRAPEADQLVEDAGESQDPTGLVVDLLGGEIVSE